MTRFYGEESIPVSDTVSLPSVTTIIGRLAKLGLIEPMWLRNSHVAAELGSRIHEFIDRINKGLSISFEDWTKEPAQVKQAVRAYMRWKESTGFNARDSELVVYSLVHGYAGRLDARGTIKQHIYICDWTSGMLRSEAKALQCGGYFGAYQEMYPNRSVYGAVTCRLDKQTGMYEEMYLDRTQLESEFEKFIDLKHKAGII